MDTDRKSEGSSPPSSLLDKRHTSSLDFRHAPSSELRRWEESTSPVDARKHEVLNQQFGAYRRIQNASFPIDARLNRDSSAFENRRPEDDRTNPQQQSEDGERISAREQHHSGKYQNLESSHFPARGQQLSNTEKYKSSDNTEDTSEERLKKRSEGSTLDPLTGEKVERPSDEDEKTEDLPFGVEENNMETTSQVPFSDKKVNLVEGDNGGDEEMKEEEESLADEIKYDKYVHNLSSDENEASEIDDPSFKVDLKIDSSAKKRRRKRRNRSSSGYEEPLIDLDSSRNEEPPSQVDAFLSQSAGELASSRSQVQSRYLMLQTDTVFSSILVTSLQDLQSMREKYEDGVLGFHNVYNFINNDLSEQVKNEMKDQMVELDKAITVMLEGLKKHSALQDYIMSSYECAPWEYEKPFKKVESLQKKKRGPSTKKSTKSLKPSKVLLKQSNSVKSLKSVKSGKSSKPVKLPKIKSIKSVKESKQKPDLNLAPDPLKCDDENKEEGEEDVVKEEQNDDDDDHHDLPPDNFTDHPDTAGEEPMDVSVTVKLENGDEYSDEEFDKSKQPGDVVKVKTENGEDSEEVFPEKIEHLDHFAPYNKVAKDETPIKKEFERGPGRRADDGIVPANGVVHRCPYCPKTFRIKRGLDGHLRIHRATIPLECDVCGETFKKLRFLEDHKRIHSDETPYECDLCNKKFRTKRSINDHRRTHTDERKYKCDQCFMAFRQLGHLNVHLKIHSGEKPYKCDECDKAFVTKTSLRYHKMVHTGEKPLTCDLCGQGFTHRGQLKNHMMHHTGERPFQCDQCSKGFIRKMELVHHMRVHTGDRPYKCDVCFNAFTHKHILDNHYRIHTGEKPYECDICGHKSRQRGDSIKHRQKMHKDVVAQQSAN